MVSIPHVRPANPCVQLPYFSHLLHISRKKKVQPGFSINRNFKPDPLVQTSKSPAPGKCAQVTGDVNGRVFVSKHF